MRQTAGMRTAVARGDSGERFEAARTALKIIASPDDVIEKLAHVLRPAARTMRPASAVSQERSIL
jgi:hypothetical protein